MDRHEAEKFCQFGKAYDELKGVTDDIEGYAQKVFTAMHQEDAPDQLAILAAGLTPPMAAHWSWEAVHRANDSVMPCGHNDQYAFSPDGVGKHIVCLLCERGERQKLKDRVRNLQLRCLNVRDALNEYERKKTATSREDLDAAVNLCNQPDLLEGLPDLLKELNDARENNKELNDLFNLQHTRMIEATQMWQQAHGKPNVQPDLGALLTWLLGLINAGTSACSQCGTQQVGAETIALNQTVQELQATLSRKCDCISCNCLDPECTCGAHECDRHRIIRMDRDRYKKRLNAMVGAKINSSNSN